RLERDRTASAPGKQQTLSELLTILVVSLAPFRRREVVPARLQAIGRRLPVMTAADGGTRFGSLGCRRLRGYRERSPLIAEAICPRDLPLRLRIEAGPGD